MDVSQSVLQHIFRFRLLKWTNFWLRWRRSLLVLQWRKCLTSIRTLLFRNITSTGNNRAALTLTKWYVSTTVTHYYTMPHSDALKKYSCGKHCEKRRNCLLQAISPSLTMFSTLYGTYIPFHMHFKISSAICFNLNQSKILSSGNGLNAVQLILYQTLPGLTTQRKIAFENIVGKMRK